jgi:hypothetical protein
MKGKNDYWMITALVLVAFIIGVIVGKWAL